MASFEQQLTEIEQRIERRVSQAVRKIALDVFTGVIQMSPVDTGRFRGNWQVATGQAPSGTVEMTDPSGATVTAQVAGEIEGMEPGDVIYLVNNLPYAQRLEDGWSQQAPGGMVALTVQRFRPVAEAAIRAARRA